MKKGLVLIIAVGGLLISCGGGQEKEAAKEFCDCYEGMLSAKKKASEAKGDDFYTLQSELAQESSKAKECLMKWKEKYDGEVELDKVKEEIKAQNEELYNMIEGQGAF